LRDIHGFPGGFEENRKIRVPQVRTLGQDRDGCAARRLTHPRQRWEDGAAMDVSELKKNAKLEIDGQPWIVTDFQFVKPGKGQGLYKCKIKNMITGSVVDRTWRSGERLVAANVESTKMQFLYSSGETFTFMDNTTYEQVEMTAEVIGTDRDYLLDNLDCDVLLYNGRPVGVSLPSHITMEVVETEASVKGDTATNVTKAATVQTGATVQVPLFIKPGERIKVDTRTGAYVERVNT
jgi:elongation factor P